MNCNECKKIIEKLVEGCIEPAELEQLKSHCEQCNDCGAEYRFAANLEPVLKQSLATEMTGPDASDEIAGCVNAVDCTAARKPVFRVDAKKWVAVAAGILIGFVLANMLATGGDRVVRGVAVPVKAVDVEGTVLVKHTNSQVWGAVGSEDVVCLGDTFLTTGDSGVVLLFEDGSTMKLEQNTEMTLKEFNGKIDFYLTDGRVHSDLRSPHSPFFISTPHGRVEALGTDFVVSVD